MRAGRQEGGWKGGKTERRISFLRAGSEGERAGERGNNVKRGEKREREGREGAERNGQRGERRTAIIKTKWDDDGSAGRKEARRGRGLEEDGRRRRGSLMRRIGRGRREGEIGCLGGHCSLVTAIINSALFSPLSLLQVRQCRPCRPRPSCFPPPSGRKRGTT